MVFSSDDAATVSERREHRKDCGSMVSLPNHQTNSCHSIGDLGQVSSDKTEQVESCQGTVQSMPTGTSSHIWRLPSGQVPDDREGQTRQKLHLTQAMAKGGHS